MKNSGKLSVSNLIIEKDSISFISEDMTRSLSFSEVNYIRVKEGNSVGKGALIGGGTMLLFSLASLPRDHGDLNQESKSEVLSLTLFSVCGAGIGALVGLAFPKERSYYIHIQE
ncbi:hypothetical protein KZP23_05720 [Echinicola marina]|uniref:hypothetical protein n=1 Tax=Echinicola marina TaxID=2859768 RepID=UPI001CF6A645|nr:hypothetical protein [Echinicola marina]UCS94520.1 hypothetical protein KZP23_05720 [Echinicola marina]